MSLAYGYWPRGYLPSIKSCGSLIEESAIRLPKRFQGVGSVNYCDEKVIGCDKFARAALETYRDSYHTMPTANVKEFAKVFSESNYKFLASEIKRRSGYEIDGGELFDLMMQAFTMIAPRTDIMDVDRRMNFSDQTVQSYVSEINAHVLDRGIEETIQANRQWEFLAKNRNGPSELPDSCGVDTRTRLVSSFYAGDYWMP